MFRLAGLLTCVLLALPAADPLQVCATVPDLGDLVRRVGGEAVAVTVFVRGGEDPHAIDPRPGFAKSLAKADLLVAVGLGLEGGWLPTAVNQSLNVRLAAGQPGLLEAGSAITPIGAAPPAADGHGAGDGHDHDHAHAAGNPHFLSDPVCGVQVARLIAQRLGQLDPARAAEHIARYRAFAAEVARRLAGERAVARVGEAAAIAALEAGDPAPLIGDDLGGWLAAMRPAAGAKIVADHDLWPYLARRFGFAAVAFMEPEPGQPPTTRHLADVVQVAQGSGARAIVANPAFDQRHIRFVADKARLPVAVLAHQVGATEDAGDWLGTIDRNVRVLAGALAGK